MAKSQENPNSSSSPSPPLSSSSSAGDPAKHAGGGSASYSGQRLRFPNPPDPSNPDPATLREQWKFAIRQYSKWYSHAWGTAIFAGLSFFALGWFIKGSNPLPSRESDSHDAPSSPHAREAQ